MVLSPRRLLSILLLWGAATAFGLAVARWTSLGPVLLTVTRGHGIHAGDVTAFVTAYGAAAVLTWLLLSWRPSARSTASRGQHTARTRSDPQRYRRGQVVTRVDVATQPLPRPYQRKRP